MSLERRREGGGICRPLDVASSRTAAAVEERSRRSEAQSLVPMGDDRLVDGNEWTLSGASATPVRRLQSGWSNPFRSGPGRNASRRGQRSTTGAPIHDGDVRPVASST